MFLNLASYLIHCTLCQKAVFTQVAAPSPPPAPWGRRRHVPLLGRQGSDRENK